MDQSTKENLQFGFLLGLAIAVIILIFAGSIYSLNYVGNKNNERRLEKYRICKEKTVDIEWCFNQFRPIL